MRSVCSTSGMKRPGPSSPCTGCSQRTSASSDTTGVVEGHLRLVVQHELVLVDRASHLGDSASFEAS